MKDRGRRIDLAPDVAVLIERSSAHPVEYAIVLIVHRDGAWHTVRTYDNAHEPREHHEHEYCGAEKLKPVVTYGTVNDAMARVLQILLDESDTLITVWEATR